MLSFLVVCLSIASAGAVTLFNINAVANKNPAIVEKTLGKPSELTAGTFNGKQVKRGKYKNGVVEITFIDDGARYITIFLQDKDAKYNKYKYPDGAWTLLGEMGLDGNATAEVTNSAVTRFKSGMPEWNNFPNVYEISMFPKGENVWYVHILTDKKYE